MSNATIDDAVSLGKRLLSLVDRAEPVATPLALGVLIVCGTLGVFWSGLGDAMKSGLAVAVLAAPLLFLYRSIHRQTTALSEHVAASASSTPLATVALYEGLKTISVLNLGKRLDVMLLARSGERYLSDLRNIDPQWGSLRVVLTDDAFLELWKTRPLARGWALQSEVLVSRQESDIHYLIAGGEAAVLGFFSAAPGGKVDYSHSLLVTPDTAGGRELIEALRMHFSHRWRVAEVVRREADEAAKR